MREALRKKMNCPIEIPANIVPGDIVVLAKNTPYHYNGDHIVVHVIRKSKNGKHYIANGTNYGNAAGCPLALSKVIQLKG